MTDRIVRHVATVLAVVAGLLFLLAPAMARGEYGVR